MQVEQIVLFVAVAALALALVLVLVAPRLRGSGRAGTPGGRRTHGAPRTTQEPALHARPPQADPVAAAVPPPPPLANMVCPTCRRQYAGGLRFCPYDARVLTLDVHSAGATPGESPRGIPLQNSGKICPSCARRYDTVAMVCGRDGSALVSVN